MCVWIYENGVAYKHMNRVTVDDKACWSHDTIRRILSTWLTQAAPATWHRLSAKPGNSYVLYECWPSSWTLFHSLYNILQQQIQSYDLAETTLQKTKIGNWWVKKFIFRMRICNSQQNILSNIIMNIWTFAQVQHDALCSPAWGLCRTVVLS